MGVPAVLGGISAVGSMGSSISSKGAQKKAQAAAEQQADRQNAFMDKGFAAWDTAQAEQRRMLDRFDDGGTMQKHLMDEAGRVGGELSNIYGDAAAGLDQFKTGEFNAPGMDQYQMGDWQQGDAYNMAGFQADQFDFSPIQQIADMANQNFQDTSAGIRSSAQDQQALAMQQGNRGLSQMMADRGISQNSGVGAQAMMEMGQQGNQQMAQLNRDLSAQGRDTALAGAQFDANTALQMGQMGSQYNLGMNQLGSSHTLGQNQIGSQYSLGRDQQQADFTLGQNQVGSSYNLGMNQLGQSSALNAYNANLSGKQHNADLFNMGTNYRTAAQTAPLQLQNQMYQENMLNPMMQGMQMNNPMQMFAALMGGQQDITQMYGNAAGNAGAGAGSAQADVWAQFQNLAKMFNGGGNASDGQSRSGSSGGR